MSEHPRGKGTLLVSGVGLHEDSGYLVPIIGVWLSISLQIPVLPLPDGGTGIWGGWGWFQGWLGGSRYRREVEFNRLWGAAATLS